jgi:hypothetical protein
MATGEKFERHRQGGATEHKLQRRQSGGLPSMGLSLCREMATSPADGSAQPNPIDVTNSVRDGC